MEFSVRLVLIILCGMVPTIGATQDATDREAVLKTVQGFFDTMTTKDIDAAGKILVPHGRFYAMDMRMPNIAPQSFSTEEYFERLQRSKYTTRERIWNPEVRVRGSIATVWAPYDLWVDGRYSHCAIDAFDLIKTDQGWKIAGDAFTIQAWRPSSISVARRWL
jgi:Putative lumazine-binding